MTAILDKIRKLLALSKSANANEAAAAAAAAQRLMQEHRIAEAELETGGPTETAQLAADPIDRFGKRSILWKELLCGSLVRLHGCKCWKVSNWTGPNVCERKLQIVGRPSDIASVRYLYAWLTSEIERLAQRDARGRGAKYAASYRWGAVRGAIAAMRAADTAVRSEANPAALVKLDARATEAEAASAAIASNIKPAHKSSAQFDADGYTRGVAAGRGLHTGAKLGAATGARLLGGSS
jgi:uncharacterized protein DUF2786